MVPYQDTYHTFLILELILNIQQDFALQVLSYKEINVFQQQKPAEAFADETVISNCINHT